MTTRPVGASADDWAHFVALGLQADLLPVVADPQATISPDSKMKALGKTPSRYNSRGEVAGFKDWTSHQATAAEVARWVKDERLGICLQTRRVRAIDVDVEDAAQVAEIQAIVEMLLGPVQWRTRADSTKCLMLVDCPGEIPKRILRTAHGAVELLGTGQQCVVASTHPKGARYEWLGGLPVPIAVTQDELDALWSALEHAVGVAPSQDSRGTLALDKPRRAADALPDPVLDHLEANGWVLGYADDGKVYVRCPQEDLHTSDNGITQAAWLPAGVGGKAEGRFHCMHATHGAISTTAFMQGVGYVEDVAADFEVVPVRPQSDSPLGFGSDAPWPAFRRTKAGILPTVGNTLAALAHPDVCTARIAYDEFKASILIEWQDDQGAWRALKDTDYVRLREQLEARGFNKPGSDLVRDCVARVAEINSMDSAIQWVRSLEWDGTERAERFFIDCWGVDDTPYARAVGRYVWTALAGRALRPGCKADMVPVLIGAQGLGKTRGVTAICPDPDAFVELSLDIHDDNLARKMRGKLVGEIGELRGLAGKDGDAIKQWLSRREEEWTPKYREFTVRFPRRLVMFGTGNNPEFLEDETGNRRWLPMTVQGTVDVDRIIAERDQLWAEGHRLFCEGGHMVEWQGAQQLAVAQHAAFQVSDDWRGVVEQWLETDAMDDADGPKRGEQPFKTLDVLTGAIGMKPDRVDARQSRRLGKLLHQLGFKLHPIRVQGKLEKHWVRVLPEKEGVE